MVATIRRYETKVRHLASVARKAGYQVRDERWVSLNWRIVTLKYLVARLFNQGDKPTFGQHARAVLAASGTAAKRAVLIGFLLAVRALPKGFAIALSQRLIKPHYM
jgi:hypothetical protein